jgi:hypothetical protein
MSYRWPILSLLLTIGLAGPGCVSPEHALGSDTPDAATVIDRYLEAAGGRAALEAVDALHAEGTVRVPDLGLEGQLTLWQREGGYSRVTLEIPGLGKIEEGTLPDLAWESSLMGPRIKRGEEKALALRNAAIEPLLDWRERFEGARIAGIDTIGEHRAYRLVLTAPGGAEQTHLIDTETHASLGTVQTLDSPMGRIEVRTRVLETRRVQGLRLPARIEQQAAGTRMVLELKKFEPNPEVPEGTFTPPEGVQALIPSQNSGLGALRAPAESANLTLRSS